MRGSGPRERVTPWDHPNESPNPSCAADTTGSIISHADRPRARVPKEAKAERPPGRRALASDGGGLRTKVRKGRPLDLHAPAATVSVDDRPAESVVAYVRVEGHPSD